MQDLRLAIRSLRATPLVTCVATLSLALAIGANTAIFSMVNGLLLRTLPVEDPHRLVFVTTSLIPGRGAAWSFPVWDQIRQRPQLFESSAAWSFVRFNLAPAGETRFVNGLWASGSFFDTLGVRAILGRTFSEADDRSGGGPDGAVAVISHSYWQRHFSGAADAIGRSLRLNGVTLTIVGVAPAEFFGVEVGRGFDVIVPVGIEPLIRGRDTVLASASTRFLTIMARLKPGQTLDAAAAELRGVQAQIRDTTLPPIARRGAAGGRPLSDRSVCPRAGRHRQFNASRTLRPAAARHHGGRPPRAADCLRQHCQPAPRACACQTSRAERAPRPRRITLAAGATTPD